jgi:hypothetical protein
MADQRIGTLDSGATFVFTLLGLDINSVEHFGDSSFG